MKYLAMLLMIFISMIFIGCSGGCEDKQTKKDVSLKKRLYGLLVEKKELGSNKTAPLNNWNCGRDEAIEKIIFVNKDWEIWVLSIIASPPRLFCFAINRKADRIMILQDDYYNFEKINIIIDGNEFKRKIKSPKSAKEFYEKIVFAISHLNAVRRFYSPQGFKSYVALGYPKQVEKYISKIKAPKWVDAGQYFKGILFVGMYYKTQGGFIQNLIKREVLINKKTGKITTNDTTLIKDIRNIGKLVR